MSDAYEKRKRRERVGRMIRLVLISCAVLAIASVLIWLAFFPPFSGI